MLYEYEYVKVIYIHESWIICVKVEKWIGKEWYKMKIMKLWCEVGDYPFEHS